MGSRPSFRKAPGSPLLAAAAVLALSLPTPAGAQDGRLGDGLLLRAPELQRLLTTLSWSALAAAARGEGPPVPLELVLETEGIVFEVRGSIGPPRP